MNEDPYNGADEYNSDSRGYQRGVFDRTRTAAIIHGELHRDSNHLDQNMCKSKAILRKVKHD